MSKTIRLNKASDGNNSSSIMEALEAFQQYYASRNSKLIDEFMENYFVPEDELTIIATGSDEICVGIEKSRELILWDWEYWGDLILDLDKASIHSEENVGWVFAEGKVCKEENISAMQRRCLSQLSDLLADVEDHAGTLHEINRTVAETLAESHRGSSFEWPLRLSAVLVRREEKWLFHQLHFSFGTNRFPDIRV